MNWVSRGHIGQLNRALLCVGAASLMIVVETVPTNAQEPATISTDRPGQVTPPAVMAPGAVQFEAGVQLASDVAEVDGAEVTTSIYSLPVMVVRVGVLDGLELRLATEYRSNRVESDQSGESLTSSGLAGLSIGAKVAVAGEDGLRPETALHLAFGLPSIGHEQFRPAAVAPTVGLAMRNALSSTVNLYYHVGGAWDGSQGAGTGFYAVLLSPSFTSSFYGFVELFGTLATSVVPMHAVDLGVAIVTAPNLQFDVFGGIGLTPSAPDYFVNIGASLRLPR